METEPAGPGTRLVRPRRLRQSNPFGRVNLWKPAVTLTPIGGGRGKPASELHDVRVVPGQIPLKYRLVMGNAVSERPDLR